MKRQNVFLGVLSDYLSKYITVTKGLSQNTIRSYTYTFQLLFVFLKETKALDPEKISFSTFDQDTLESFFAWMEEKRGCGISTRNQKLSGLSAFAKYAVNREPVLASGFYNAVKRIPKKKLSKTIPVYFTKEEISILLRLPSGNGKTEYRNRTLLSVLYATGARAQEICDIRVGDICFSDRTSIKLLGKGNKARKVTIPAQCAALIKAYLSHENKLDSLDSHVFRNYTPHSFRHSIAVHMLESGIPLPVTKNFLGHSSIEVTMIYATVSDELENKYLKENGIAAALVAEEK